MTQNREALVFERLRAGGAKLTPARKAVVRAFLKLGDRPVTVEALHAEQARMSKKPCDLASVYRTMTLLEQLKLVRRSDLFGEAAHFEWAEPGHHHRHLIVCRSCQRMDAIDICLVQAEQRVLGHLGYKEISHRLEFSGVCPACAS